MTRPALLAAALVASVALPAAAGQVEIVSATATETARGVFRVSVTLRHADAGWDHHADEWRVLAPDGTVLGVRTLLHPHVEEQPFTRSLGGVEVPAGLDRVLIDARDSVHGRTEAALPLALPNR